MTEPTTQSALDRLRRVTTEESDRAKAAAAPPAAAERVLGLKFQPGDRVVDLSSGRKGTISSGFRAPASGRGVYVVQFDGAHAAHRDDRELELDRPAAPAPSVG